MSRKILFGSNIGLILGCRGAAWAQTFAYDAFGNLNKTANAGTNYQASYSASTNQVSLGVPASYDADGNQTQNSWTTVSWNAVAQPIVVNGVTATYDALGRMVEVGSGSTYAEVVYRPSGDKLAVVQNGSVIKGTIPLPGGGTAIYNAGGLSFIRHKDWLGSSRLATTWNHAVYAKEAYAPFGETYNEAGTPDRSFTGQDQDTTRHDTTPRMGAVEYPKVPRHEHLWNERSTAKMWEKAGVYSLLRVNACGIRPLWRISVLAVCGA